MKKFYSIIVIIVCSTWASAQVQNESSLSIGEIMKGDKFVGYLPSRINWSDDSKTIYFDWNPEMDTIGSTYKAVLGENSVGKVGLEELKGMSSFGSYSKDGTRKVYGKNGDLFLLNISTDQTIQITNTLQRESSGSFSGDEKSVVFRIGDNLFTWGISSGVTTQLTDFKKGNERNKPKSKGQQQWLDNDQLAYFDVLEKRENTSTARNNQRELVSPDRPKSIYMGDQRLGSAQISPNLRYVVYQLVKDAKGKNTIVPAFVTKSGYTEDLNAHTKVGAPQSVRTSWVYDREEDKTYEVKTDSLPGLLDKPDYLKDYVKDGEEYKDKFEKPRTVNTGSVDFSAGGKAIMNVTSEDHKDRWIVELDLTTGALKSLDRQRDEAWIGGPGIGWFSAGSLGWISEDLIWYKSEVSGFVHLYTHNLKTGKSKTLTKGNFEVLRAKLSRDKSTFFMTTNEVSPHEQHFYHMPVSGGKRTKITTLKGGHQVTISPNEKQLAILYSSTTKPWELYSMPNVAGSEMTQLTESTTDAFKAYSWRDAEIIQFKARDGVMVPATIYKPTAEKNNGAAVIFVHGAGYLQNVHTWWHSYYREYMFHNMLVDNGYTVLAIDYRASAGYGRDWRTGIYRFMGGKDLDDNVDGAKYLVDEHGIDADRLGIYGGSYGGFITLMALFNSPGTFKSGAALRSVTDWAHYNHGYTSNILNTPVQDSIAYYKSSPIYHAEKFEGNLLMLHGMVDRNVHFQDVVRLSQRLIELKKENWELAVFPMEGHGFQESSSWTDEYRRIYELFQETLRE